MAARKKECDTALERYDVVQKYPLTEQQKGLWFLYKLNPEDYRYNNFATYELKGVLNEGVFKNAILAVFNFFESYRIVFSEDAQGEVSQSATKFFEKDPVEFIDLSNEPLSSDERCYKALEIIGNRKKEKFDLGNDYVARIHLIKCSQDLYYFSAVQHHIVSDALSAEMFSKAVSIAYNEGAAQLGEHFSSKVLQDYFEYINSIKPEQRSARQEYWRDNLKNSSITYDFGPGYSKSNEEYKYSFERFTLDKKSFAQIKSCSRKCKSTPFLFLTAVWSTLLYRYFAKESFLLGYPVNIRPKHLKDIHGFFVTMLPFKVVIDSNDSFCDLLSRVTTQRKNDSKFQEVVISDVSSFFNADASGQPLDFNVGITATNFYTDSLQLDGLEIKSLDTSGANAGPERDLNLSFDIQTESLEFELSYNETLFGDGFAKNLIGHFKNIIKEVLNDGEQKITDIDYLSAEEKRKLLVEFNDTAKDFPKDKIISELFEEQVAKTPDNTALIYEDKEMSYKELNERSNQLANYLRKKGVKAESLVGICVERSFEMIVGIMGILKAGGAYVPIDPEYPQARKRYMLEDSDCKILLTHKAANGCKKFQGEEISLDKDWEEIAKESRENLEKISGPENLAYVIYTSGTTGKPKGVCIEQISLVNLCQWHIDEFEVTEKDRATKYAGWAFDASVWEVYPYLLAGASLYLMPTDLKYDVKEISDFYNKNNITIAFIPPHYVDELVKYENASLRYLLTGGDRLPKLADCNYKLVNNYGPTENTVVTTSIKLDGDLSIGKPINNSQVFILGPNRQLVPPGVPGELCIGGVGLARSYLNKEEVTKSKFIKNPLSSRGRIYRTGDLARWLPDGNIEFLGRIDDQVKIRGHRIEPGEIEKALMTIEGIEHASVLGKQNDHGENYLVGYIKFEYKEKTLSEIRGILSNMLPSNMIPSQFVGIPEVPLTENGKIDKERLKEYGGKLTDNKKLVKPRNEIEKTLVSIWSEVLNIPKKDIGVNSSFFELGGDSILSIRLAQLINQHGYDVAVSDIFHNPVIELLALKCKVTDKGQIAEINRETPIKLTPIQKWFFEKNFNSPNHWNQAVILEASKDVTKDVLKNLVSEIYNCFVSLNISFVKDDSSDEYVGKFKDEVNLDKIFVYEDLTKLSAAEQKLKYRLDKNKYQESLDIEVGDLSKFVVFDFGHEKKLLWVIHHLVIDGISWRILLNALNTAYGYLANNQKVSLPSNGITLQHWCDALHKYSKEERVSNSLDYWVSELDSFDHIVNDSFKYEGLEGDFKHEIKTIDKKRTSWLLKDADKAYNTETNDILLSALSRTVSSFVDGDSYPIWLEGHGREGVVTNNLLDVSNTVGWFSTIFPVKLDISSDKYDVARIIKTTKEKIRKIPNKGIDFGVIKYIKKSNKLRNLSIPEITFNYLGNFEELNSGNYAFRYLDEETGISRAANNQQDSILSINAYVVNGMLKINYSHNMQIVSNEISERFIENFVNNLNEIVDHCIENQDGGYTASDFTDASLSQETIDELFVKYG